jgi:hypothetical protein
MRQIYKYDISKPIVGRIEEFLHLGYQNNKPMVWAIVDDDAPEQNYSIICSGTGWPIADFQSAYNYLGTLQDEIGYVWHYFVVPAELIDGKGRSLDVEFKFVTEEDSEDEDEEFTFDKEQAQKDQDMFRQYMEYVMKRVYQGECE